MKFQWIRDFIVAAGGRRFLMTVGAGLVDTGLLIGHFMSAEIYRDLTLATVGAYIAAGTAQHVMAKRYDASVTAAAAGA